MSSVSALGSTSNVITPTDNANGTTTINNTDQFGEDTFLKLLVAQLKYQDPQSPTDPSQFLSQTAQFTMVEKLNQMAATTTAMSSASQLANATSMIGKQISYVDSGTGNTIQAIVKSIKVDSTNGASLVLQDGTNLPLSAITAVDLPQS